MFFLYLILRLAFKVDTPTTQEPAQSTANNNIMLLSPVFGDVLVVSAGFTCVVELFPQPCVLPFPVWLLPFPVLLLLLSLSVFSVTPSSFGDLARRT